MIETSDGKRPTVAGKLARPGAETDAATQRVLDLADRGLNRGFRLAGLILGDQVEAEDATQDALIRAWRAASTLRDAASFDAWFDRILINICRDRLRRRGRIRVLTLDLEAEIAVADDPFRRIYENDDVLRAMTAVGDDERIVLILHFWADMTLEAVGTRLGWPVGTVKSRLHRGLKTMRAQLGHPGGTGGISD